MNSSSRRNTRENTISGAGTTIVAKSKPETKVKLAAVSYDYEAAISQPDIPTYSDVDKNTREPCLNTCDVSSTPHEKANFFSTCGRMGVTIKRRGIRSKARPKKITKKEVTKVRDVRKPPETAVNEEKFERKIVCEEMTNLRKDGNPDEIVESTRLCVSRNKTSKIPRMKPNFFSLANEESRVYPNTKSPARNKLKVATGMTSPACREKEKLVHQVHACNESAIISKTEISNVNDCHQDSKTVNIARIVRKNSTNFFRESLDKSSEADADFEENLSTDESPIVISADDVPRSVASANMKRSSLKCECHLRNNHKYTSAARKGRYSETDYGSSSEMESTRKLFKKSIGDSEFTDMSTEDTDLLSDYIVDYNHVKTTDRNKDTSRHTSRAMKPSSLTNNPARMRTSFSFFNVFFDIVFWPFILLRTKQ